MSPAPSGAELSWDALYAYLVNATGWTWETIRWELDLPRLAALSKYWEDMPPLHIEVARLGAAFGVPRPEKSSKTTSSSPAKNDEEPSDFVELLGMFPTVR